MRKIKKNANKLNGLGFIAASVITGAAIFGAFNAAKNVEAFSDSDFVTDIDGIHILNPDETDGDDLLPSIETLPEGYTPTETTEEVVDDPFNFGEDQQETEETSLSDGIFSFDSETESPEVTTDPADTDNQEAPVPTLYLTYYTFNLTVGQEAQIYWYVENSIFGGYHEQFSIDNPSVAEVSESGVITAKSAGSANITVTWGDLTATAAVTVSEAQTTSPPPDTHPITDPVSENTSSEIQDTQPSEPIPETVKVKLDGCLYNTSGNAVADVVLKIGDNTVATDLNGYFSFPQTDIGNIMIFSAMNERLGCTLNISSNTTVFLLYSGETIECFSSYDEMATRFVITEIDLETPNKRIYAGDVLIPYFQYEPRDATLTHTEYVSSNENVAAVDENGVITAKAAGEAIITLILNNGQAQTAFTITVNPQEIGKYSGIIAAVEILIILIVLGSAYVVYKRYKRRMDDDNAAVVSHKSLSAYTAYTTETAENHTPSNTENESKETIEK